MLFVECVMVEWLFVVCFDFVGDYVFVWLIVGSMGCMYFVCDFMYCLLVSLLVCVVEFLWLFLMLFGVLLWCYVMLEIVCMEVVFDLFGWYDCVGLLSVEFDMGVNVLCVVLICGSLC